MYVRNLYTPAELSIYRASVRLARRETGGRATVVFRLQGWCNFERGISREKCVRRRCRREAHTMKHICMRYIQPKKKCTMASGFARGTLPSSATGSHFNSPRRKTIAPGSCCRVRDETRAYPPTTIPPRGYPEVRKGNLTPVARGTTNADFGSVYTCRSVFILFYLFLFFFNDYA